MKRFRGLVFPALILCFVLFLGGFFLGRQTGRGVLLTTQQAAPAGTEAPERALSPAAATEPAGTPETRLELNRATLEELMDLPGIGEVRARRILEYRETHGPFRTAAELMNVEGIGEGIFAGLRDLIYVEATNENPDY